VEDYRKIESVYYDDISQRRHRAYGNQTLEEIYKERFEEHLGYTFKELLCGSFDTLKQIELPDAIAEEIKQVFDYQGKYQKHIADIFKTHLDIHTCYYCNLDFVNVFKAGNKKSKSGYTLDHIKSKSDYPHLALSLYNFVPSCYVCNSKLKKDQDIGDVAPTSETFDFDQKVAFKTFLANTNLQVNTQDDFDLFLKEDFTDEYQKYINVFELDGRYAYHKYKVLELINKRKAYPDSRIKELAGLTQKTEEEVRQDIFGEYFPDAMHKRPLSKLIKDISAELGLI
jgi:5-methylcytosine-specific restriction endonuclease McrA